jgi:hypothetical protein
VRILIKLLLIIGCFASAAHAQCGLKNSTSLLFPSDWTTKTPPQKGNSYTDALGCVVTQISDAFSDNGVATTGTISSGALTTMVVGSTAAIFLNRGICIQGAGSTTWSGGTNMLVTYPTAITGTTLTLHDAALGAGTFNVYGCYGFLAHENILEPGGTVVQFWNVPRCGLSYDATILACDSNFDINVPMGSSDANEPYSDTFLIKTQVPTTTVTPGPATTMFVKANKNMTNPTMTVQYH